MAFRSILSPNAGERQVTDAAEAPAFFRDLNLDQIVDAVTAGREEYDLKPFFYAPLADAATIRYRQEVMRDLENSDLIPAMNTFSDRMVTVRRHLGLAENLDSPYHREGWFLEAALDYCRGVMDLAGHLDSARMKAPGLLALREYLSEYARSPRFQSLFAEAQRVRARLSDIRYCVNIRSGRFTVRKYEGEPDYSQDVEATFDKFKREATKDYRSKLSPLSGVSHIEAKILDFVARLYPDEFAPLDHFCQQYGGFVDPTLHTFEREVQFYVAYLTFLESIRAKGLVFCYPDVSLSRGEIAAQDAFDLALAHKLLSTDRPVVSNDFELRGPERIIVVTGPNQGGKTTFARMFGQLHYLASLGCPVPGTKARLSLFDQMFSHFEREEDIRNLRGKLQDDMVRTHSILTRATPRSIVIVNEVFASTALDDAVFLSKAILLRLMDLDLLCVWVTFIDELSSLSEKTVSMVSTVVPENPAVRTFKILRKPADGLAYALSIARKHRLTGQQIRERLRA